MNPLIQLKRSTPLFLIALACFGLSPMAQALLPPPPPDGGYPGGNTAEGQSALLSRTSGQFNTAVGYVSLLSDSTGSFNTAVGAGTLLANTANENTAIGAGAVLPEGKRIPPNSLVIGVPGRIVRQTTSEERERIKRTVEAYLELSEQHQNGRWK